MHTNITHQPVIQQVKLTDISWAILQTKIKLFTFRNITSHLQIIRMSCKHRLGNLYPLVLYIFLLEFETWMQIYRIYEDNNGQQRSIEFILLFVPSQRWIFSRFYVTRLSHCNWGLSYITMIYLQCGITFELLMKTEITQISILLPE